MSDKKFQEFVEGKTPRQILKAIEDFGLAKAREVSETEDYEAQIIWNLLFRQIAAISKVISIFNDRK
ncbi:MAG TPA: hypothetical protein ENH85_03135 [Candidatus Scalindua sp.]|nr:hypothetical protein [Candidatus Scalindua sp.]